ncbi:4-amino-4-deoxychorismate lyase [Rhizobium sp. PP-F2F-G48]|uniref:aminotransferase class IV family protein n=1 Tax=Rhizobium sp. PP-F2F-G48 TaxID=2135651 RepID=UPI0010510EB2|nr:aminotransferase class IV family protein [Rhizobium sp. PP-F2F-G48]TCM53650.1 4-amino-4-deoxychorismate lyase [Rhizobium sp. PP-F2F-G48]
MTGFTLIETLRYEPPESPDPGFLRLRLHIARLSRSARRLGFTLPDDVADHLERAVAKATAPARVRLELAHDGRIDIAVVPFAVQPPGTVWRVRLAKTRLASTDPLLRYKTSRRAAYDAARAEWPAGEADEVLLLNERGEPCEGTITSLFLDDGSGILKTPPIACGLLAGVLRTELICARRARVERLTLDGIRKGTLFMGNSLRGLIPARLTES